MKKSLNVVLLSAILVIGLVALFFFPSPSPSSSKPEAASSLPTTTPDSTPLVANPPPSPAVTAQAPAPIGTPTTAKALPIFKDLQKAFNAINAAGDANTPESLQTLVSYASMENAEIRAAALGAMIRRDDVSAAPLLRKAAKQLDDSAIIIDLLKTADYLELPPANIKALTARPKRPKPAPEAAAPTQPATQTR